MTIDKQNLYYSYETISSTCCFTPPFVYFVPSSPAMEISHLQKWAENIRLRTDFIARLSLALSGCFLCLLFFFSQLVSMVNIANGDDFFVLLLEETSEERHSCFPPGRITAAQCVCVWVRRDLVLFRWVQHTRWAFQRVKSHSKTAVKINYLVALDDW